MNYVLGIDIGTTAIKAALFDENGFIQGSATKEYELIALPTGEIEQNFEVYEKAFKDAISGAIAMSGAAHEDVVCLGISATGETILFIDEEDKPLRKVITWLDNRAVEEAAYLNSCFNRKEFLQRTGWSTVHPGTPAAKILWVKRHEPDIFRKSQKIVLIKDYFIFRLTGKYVSEDSLMCDSMYWDMGNRQYWPEMLEKLDVIAEMLPEVCQPGMELDTVTPEAAAEFGLNTQMRINVGGMDQACGAIGAGNIRSGMLSESTGSALVALSIVDEFVVDQNGIVPTFAAGIPGQYMLHTFSTGAIVMKWFRDEFCLMEKSVGALTGINSYALIDKEVEMVEAGSDGLIMLPYLHGKGAPDLNEKAKGVFFGITSAHTKRHFSRAIMEGIAMTLRRMLEGTEALGIKVREIRSLGGGAKSSAWCQIKADVLGLPVKVIKDSESAPCMGAAILAGVANGMWPSVGHAVDRFVLFEKTCFPNPKLKEVYESAFKKFKELDNRVSDIF